MKLITPACRILLRQSGQAPVTRVRDWPHSSFHRDARAGMFPVDWGGDAETTGEFGER
jgi:hypothetical protein